MMCRHISN